MRPLFEEKQRFTQWWVWTIIVAASTLILGIFGNAMYQQMVLGKPWGDKPVSDSMLIMLTLFTITLMFLMLMIFFNALLEIVVDKGAVTYRFFPLIRSWQRLDREVIQSFEVRQYYLKGYGISRNLRGDKAISVKGTTGIEITMVDGSKVLLGTQQPGEFLSALNKMKNRSED